MQESAIERSETCHPLDPGAPPSDPVDRPTKDKRPRTRVPIRSLRARHRSLILSHLCELEPEDRYLRFGYAATDAHLERYVVGLDFDRDPIFGVVNRQLRLIAVAHLAYGATVAGHQAAEFGVSVLKHARGRGYGARLFERAAMHARNAGVDEMYIHALSENAAMLQIARKAGAIVVRYGSESEAHLHLPPGDLDSLVTELIQQQWALADHRFKRRAWEFQRVLGSIGAPSK